MRPEGRVFPLWVSALLAQAVVPVILFVVLFLGVLIFGGRPGPGELLEAIAISIAVVPISTVVTMALGLPLISLLRKADYLSRTSVCLGFMGLSVLTVLISSYFGTRQIPLPLMLGPLSISLGIAWVLCWLAGINSRKEGDSR
jgi:hypothetical protein